MHEAPPRRSGGRRQRMNARNERREDTSMLSGTPIASPYTPLSAAQLSEVHNAALRVLETMGRARATPRVLEAALDHGCWQDDAGRLRFPPGVVEAYLKKAAKSFCLSSPMRPKIDAETDQKIRKQNKNLAP